MYHSTDMLFIVKPIFLQNVKFAHYGWCTFFKAGKHSFIQWEVVSKPYLTGIYISKTFSETCRIYGKFLYMFK